MMRMRPSSRLLTSDDVMKGSKKRINSRGSIKKSATASMTPSATLNHIMAGVIFSSSVSAETCAEYMRTLVPSTRDSMRTIIPLMKGTCRHFPV